MSDERKRIEPSIDEILASIRHIITDDAARPASAPLLPEAGAPPAVDATPTAEGEPRDILLLTEMLAEDGSVVSLADAGAATRSVAADPPTPDARPSRQEPSLSRPAAEPALARAEEPTMAAARIAGQALMSRDRAQASAVALRELVRSVEADKLSLGGGSTLEAVVREELRPLLRDWLDAYLPPLVERLVRAEIDRVVARAEVDVGR